MVRHIRVRPRPEAVAQSAMGTGAFSSTISGAFGYVSAHHIKTASVSVELLNGIVLMSVASASREWVCDINTNTSAGAVDLPPVGSLVFVFFPYGIENTSGAFVLASFFDYTKKSHADLLVEGDESKVTTVRAGGIKTVYDRKTGNYTVSDIDDTKLSIRVDKENKNLAVTDWNDNKVTLDSNGITLEAKGNTVKMETGKVLINGHLEVSQ